MACGTGLFLNPIVKQFDLGLFGSILTETTNKKYSTFELYSDEEFKESLNSFENWLKDNTEIRYIAEMGEIIYRKI